jgi:uncharacterized protein YyaL (SSP411 family)
MDGMPNRLAASTSPYLLQHADNPVDWYEWGDEAFAEAARRDVPVLLSVGYAACHWCHVMAHESFEDEATAAVMNEHFVNVKVDREERPDVDAVYMEAVQALTGHGGWPMTAFLTPRGRVFYAGTYYPSRPRHQMPSFTQVLAAVTQAWTTRRDEVEMAGARIVGQLAARSVVSGSGPPSAADLDAAVEAIAAEYDHEHHGFGSAPKFPPSMVLEWLLRHHARTGRPDALSMVSGTAQRMARSGMYDQLAGGFARYSVDRAWVVPHFEKMLYDNALLLRSYLHWWQATSDPLAERVVRQTAAFLLEDLRTPEGGFASSLDADAAGEEGLTYVWTPAQLEQVLGEQDGRWAAALLTVTPHGTFEKGASTLQLPAEPDDPVRWAAVRAKLRQARALRPQPARDDKVVAAWNGWAGTALAEAGVALGEPTWVDAASRCATLVLEAHRDAAGRLRRVSRDGRAGTPEGVLEDYAALAETCLALLAATGDASWLDTAAQLLEHVLTRFFDGDSQLYDTAADATDDRLGRRPQDPTDNATPSGRSAAAGALLGYAAFTGSSRHRDAAEAALAPAQGLARRAPRFVSWALAAAESRLSGPLEVAVIGDPADPATRALHHTAVLAAPPGSAIIAAHPADMTTRIPLLAGRGLVDGAPAAYVCRGFVCRRPATEPADLREELRTPAPR